MRARAIPTTSVTVMASGNGLALPQLSSCFGYAEANVQNSYASLRCPDESIPWAPKSHITCKTWHDVLDE